MKQRDQVAMTADEALALLAAGRKVQLASNGRDGFPHLVTMYYVLSGGQIAFWTYRKSQKALNLARDPRISCLVEDGQEYFDLRGVLVLGIAHKIDDTARITDIGRGITAVVGGPLAEADPGALDEYVAGAASKRYAYLVEPRRIISWDHTKLASN